MSYVSEVLADNPLGYWRQGDASGSTMTDSSGNGRHGTYPATNVALGVAGLLVGDADTCADYASTSTSNGISVVADAAWMDVTTITVEAIIRPDTVSAGSYNFILNREQSSFGPFWFVTRTAKLELAVWVNGLSGPTQVTGTTTLVAGTKYHVAATYDGVNVKLYVNGALDKTQALAGTLNSGTHPIRIGNWITSSLPFDGKIDEVAYYGTALSGARILAHYGASISPNFDGALATETDTPFAGTVSTSVVITGSLATEVDDALPGSVAIGVDPIYTVDLKVGAHEFTITSNDTVDEDDPIHVLDALNIAWQVEESEPWPAQPDPVEATIGFWTGDVDNLEDVDINTPISIVLTDQVGDVFGTFHGRVAQLDAHPVKRKAGLFTLYTVHGKDYTRDPDELPITIPAEWPAESGDDRFARIVAAITAAGGAPVEPPADCDTAAFEAYSAGTTNAGTLLNDHLRQIAVPGDYGPERYLLVPVVVADALDHFECIRLIKTVDAALLPGVLDVVGGLLTLLFPDDEADGLVDAGIVLLDSQWTRLKYRAVNRVAVTGDSVHAEITRPGSPVRLTIDSTLTNQPAAERMADMYLPDPAETNGWVTDTLRLQAWRGPSTITPAWFPDHREDPASTSVYLMPIAVLGIAPEINLAGNQAYAGQLTNVSLTIAERRPAVDFSLRLQLPLGIGAEAASWEWLEDEHPTITWEDVDPDLSWYEARLARRS